MIPLLLTDAELRAMKTTNTDNAKLLRRWVDTVNLDYTLEWRDSFNLYQLDQIKVLSMQGCELDDDDVTFICDMCVQVEDLNLNNNPLTDASLEAVAMLPVKALSVDGTNMDGSGLIAFEQNLPSLRKLVISFEAASDGIMNLTYITTLVDITVNGIDVGDTFFLNLVRLPVLERVDVSGTNIALLPTPSMVEMAKRCVSLRQVVLQDYTDSAMETLSYFPNLQILDISDAADVSNDGLMYLPDFTSLEVLRARRVITQDTIEVLSTLALRELDISLCEIGDDNIMTLPDTLVSLNLADTNVTDITALARLTRLKTLDLTNLNLVDISAVKLMSLTHLRLVDAMFDITQLEGSSIEQLDLTGSHFDVTHLDVLTTLPLTRLNLTRTGVRDVNLPGIDQIIIM